MVYQGLQALARIGQPVECNSSFNLKINLDEKIEFNHSEKLHDVKLCKRIPGDSGRLPGRQELELPLASLARSDGIGASSVPNADAKRDPDRNLELLAVAGRGVLLRLQTQNDKWPEVAATHAAKE